MGGRQSLARRGAARKKRKTRGVWTEANSIEIDEKNG
jgi:hypothetical protein